MKLNFEIVDEVGEGKYPDVIHFPNTQAQLFYFDSGKMVGTPSDQIDYGEWGDIEWLEPNDISPDTNMSHLQLDILQAFGIIGNYKQNAENKHKLIIHEFQHDMSDYLSEGNISMSSNNSINEFTLRLENPDIKNPEVKGNVAINEHNTLISPGAKIEFRFSMGDSEEMEMGFFFVDRSSFTLASETVSVEGRSLIGKVLKDQTLDEHNEFELNYINLVIESLFEQAGLDPHQYMVETSNQKNSFKFNPTTDLLETLLEMFKVMNEWKIEELVDGTIVVGSETYSMFPTTSTYSFERNKDIFSRNIVRDDAESYRRVCVHDREFTVAVYKDVNAYEGWNLNENKTLYITVPEGTKSSEANAYATEIAKRLENVGKVETFVGPFRPQLMIGDGAVITTDEGNEDLGLITGVSHRFGKEGFFTEFIVDSGGTLGKGRLIDYLGKITKTKISGEVGYEDEGG